MNSAVTNETPELSVPDDSPPAPRRMGWPRRVASALIAAAGGLLVLLTLAGFAGKAAWWLDLTNHFRPHFALGLLVVAVLQLLLRPRWLAGAWLAGAAVAGVTLWPLFLSHSRPTAAGSVTIVHANTGGDTVDAAALTDWIRSQSPEWVSLQEITPRNLPKIAAKLPEYDVVADAPRGDTRGVALLHLHRDDGPPVTAKVIRPTPDSDRPMVTFSFDLAGGPVSVLGFHTTRPAPANNWRWQRQGTDAAAVWAAAQQFAGGGEAVVIGDFNSTAAGTHVAEMCRRSNLFDARRGHGPCGTWPSDWPAFLRVGIDGAYHSVGLVCEKFRVGPDINSDHRPIAVTFERGK